MNTKISWYKTAKLKGEWWIIDGQAFFADAEVCDINHSGMVIEHIIGTNDLPENIDLTRENKHSLKEMGLSEEEIKVVLNEIDPRDYGMKNLGWKRVSGNHVQTQTLTQEDLRDIDNGLFDINNEIQNDEEINIEVMGNRTYYLEVPYSTISSGNVSDLIHYGRHY